MSTLVSPTFRCNDTFLVGQMIREGKGVGLRSNWDIKSDVLKGSLKNILPQMPLKQGGDVWLLSHPSKMRTHKVSTLFNYLEARLKECF